VEYPFKTWNSRFICRFILQIHFYIQLSFSGLLLQLAIGSGNFGRNQSNLSVNYLSFSLFFSIEVFLYRWRGLSVCVLPFQSHWMIGLDEAFSNRKKKCTMEVKKKGRERQNNVPHHKSRFSTKPDPLSSSHTHRHCQNCVSYMHMHLYTAKER